MLTQAWNTLLLELVNNLNELVTTEELTTLADKIKTTKYGDPTIMRQFRQDVLPVATQLAENDVACLGAMQIFQGCKLQQVFEIMTPDEQKTAFEALQDLYNRAALEKTCQAGIEDVQNLCARTIQNAEAEGVDLTDAMQAMPALMRSLLTGEGLVTVSRIVEQITHTADPEDVCNLLKFNGAGAIGESLAAEIRRGEAEKGEKGEGGGGGGCAGREEPQGLADFLSPENMARMIQATMAQGAGIGNGGRASVRGSVPFDLKNLFAQVGNMFPPPASAAEQVD